jgi:hypothetical protein
VGLAGYIIIHTPLSNSPLGFLRRTSLTPCALYIFIFIFIYIIRLHQEGWITLPLRELGSLSGLDRLQIYVLFQLLYLTLKVFI